MQLSEKLQQLRKQKNWTQAYAAREIGIQQSYLSKLENGHFLPSIEVLKQISNSYQVELIELQRTYSQPRGLSGQKKRYKKEIQLSLAISGLLFGLAMYLSGYFNVFYNETFYTYIEVSPNQTSIADMPKNQAVYTTDNYLGEVFNQSFSNTTVRFQLHGERKISRVENQRLMAGGLFTVLLSCIVILMYRYNIKKNKNL